jgi:hypothetical protein
MIKHKDLLEGINEGADLMLRILNELGGGYSFRLGSFSEGVDENYCSYPSFEIIKTGLAGSKNSILGAKKVLQLRGKANERKIMNLKDLTDYVEKRPDLITPQIRKILSQGGLEGLRSSMLVNDEELVYSVLNGFGKNFFIRLGETYKNKDLYRTLQDCNPGAESILPTVDMCLSGFVFPKRVFGLVSGNYEGKNIEYFENYKQINIPKPVKEIISQAGLTEINS